MPYDGFIYRFTVGAITAFFRIKNSKEIISVLKRFFLGSISWKHLVDDDEFLYKSIHFLTMNIYLI